MGNSSSRMRVIFILRVDNESGWERSVVRGLNKCYGVESYRMADVGLVEICGSVDPSAVLRMLRRAGRSAELCWFQIGECSTLARPHNCHPTTMIMLTKLEDDIDIAC